MGGDGILKEDRVKQCKSTKIEKSCAICDKNFSIIKSKSTQKTCSRKCYLIAIKLNGIYKKSSGGYRKGSGRSKGGYYKKSYFDSQFEIEVAKFLDKNNIKWIRNTKRFYYTFKGIQTYYIPDFYFPKLKLYLETKGYWYKDKKEKTYEAIKQNNINQLLLMQKEEWNINKNILMEKIKDRWSYYSPV